jgi:hypothetical protein
VVSQVIRFIKAKLLLLFWFLYDCVSFCLNMIADSDHSDQDNEVGEVLDAEGSEVSDDVMEQADEIPEITTEAVPFDRNLPSAHRNPTLPTCVVFREKNI